jgi:hypothetical protein
MGYAPGDRVTHTQYGDGTLESVNEYHTVINFDEHGRRVFSSPRVILASSNSVAPPKPVRKRATKKTAAAKQPVETTPSPE